MAKWSPPRSAAAFPTDPDQLNSLRRQLLDQLVENELLVQAAERDTAVRVTEEQIQQAADERVREVRDQFPSHLDYERGLQEAGIGTPDEHRRFMVEQMRTEMLTEALKQYLKQTQMLRPIPPTEAEMREYFEENRKRPGWPGQRPPTVTFRQIVIKPQPDSAALLLAFNRADSVLQRLRRGEDFTAVAAEFSDDPGTKDRGGELGWFRRATMTPAFERAAFSMRPGEFSNPVLTPFGFHVIQVQRVDAAEVQARHVLVTPEITEKDVERARMTTDSVIDMLRAGVPFDSLVRTYHYEEDRTLVDRVAKENLPPAYSDSLANAQPGDVIGPLVLEDQGGERYAIVIFEDALDEGVYTFEELRERIYSQLGEDNGMRRYIDELRNSTYVDVRLPS